MFELFLATHHGHEGVGSGCTVVAAPSEDLARFAVMEYLRGKPDGHAQCHSADLLEIEPYADSHMSGESVDASKPGVLLEYRLEHLQPDEIIHFGFDVDGLADELDRLHKSEHDGRGVSCVETLVFYLRRHDFDKAKAVARNESDKIRSYPEIVDVLKRIGFWYEIDFSKWSQD